MTTIRLGLGVIRQLADALHLDVSHRRTGPLIDAILEPRVRAIIEAMDFPVPEGR
jgi:hypothetical protein